MKMRIIMIGALSVMALFIFTIWGSGLFPPFSGCNRACAGESSTANFPKADKDGEFAGRIPYPLWRVVDPDPNGLNGRLASDFPRDWESCNARWPKMDESMYKWPVIRTFRKGSLLMGQMTNAGSVILTSFVGTGDKEKKERWLFVKFGLNGEVCFVRAKTQYIEPVKLYMPKPDKNGDYSAGSLWRKWQVVDKDPEGLNSRCSPDFPSNPITSPSSSWPRLDIQQWPVVGKRESGSEISALFTCEGHAIVNDIRGKPWLLTSLYDSVKKQSFPCFVRANSSFIKPIADYHIPDHY
jgi:hypothetical protein